MLKRLQKRSEQGTPSRTHQYRLFVERSYSASGITKGFLEFFRSLVVRLRILSLYSAQTHRYNEEPRTVITNDDIPTLVQSSAPFLNAMFVWSSYGLLGVMKLVLEAPLKNNIPISQCLVLDRPTFIRYDHWYLWGYTYKGHFP
jgi:hypothetical protein